MKKLLCALILVFVVSATTIAAEVTRSYTFTTATSGAGVNLTNSAAYTHYLIWTGKGTRTTCQIKVSQSTTGAFAGEETDLIAAQTCTSDGSANTTGYANYVQVTVTTISGSGNTLYAKYEGFPATDLGTDTGGQLLTTSGRLADMFHVASTTASNVEETWLAADANKRWMLTGVWCANIDATNNAIVGIYDTASGSAFAYIPCPAATNSTYGGAIATTGITPIAASAKNKSLILKATAAATTLYITLIGYWISY